MKEKVRRLAIVIIGGILIVFICALPIILEDKEKKIQKNLPEYKEIKVNEEVVQNTEKKETTKKSLEQNEYFKKLVTSPDYNYTKVKKAIDPRTGMSYVTLEDGYLSNMITNFMFNFEIKNKEAISSLNEIDGVFCMTVPKTKEAFEELYYTTMGFNDLMDYIPGYYELVTKSAGNFCFNYGILSNDSEILVGIDSLSMSEKKNITATVYLYEIYTTGTQKEKQLINTVKKYIDMGDYASAKKVTENNLNGRVTHKKIVFRINNEPKYFEYKLLYSFQID